MTTAYTSLLGLALPVPGELTGTWGSVVNNSITSLLDTAIAGVATASVTSGDWTLSDIDGASSDARAAIIRPTGSPGVGVSRNIIAPSQSKAYIIQNESNGPVVIKGSSTTGITIAAGKTTLVAWNGSDFVEIVPSLSTTATAANGLNSATTTVAVSSATAPTTGQVLTATSGSAATWQTPTASGGTVTSVAATVPSFLSVSGSPIIGAGTLAISYSGTALPVANGGTGTTTPSLVPGTNVTISGTWPNQTINASGGGGGSVTSVSGTGSVNGITLSGTVTSTGSLTLGGTLSNVSLSSQVTGTLPVANGGTGLTSPGTSGNVLTSNGSGWVSSAPSGGSLTGLTTSITTRLGVSTDSGTGFNNVLVGTENIVTTGSGNTAVGYQAIYNATSAFQNVAIGYYSMPSAINGNANTGVGTNSLRLLTSGSYNVALGHSALNDITTGSGNIGIGVNNSSGSYAPVFTVTTQNNRVVMGSSYVTNAYVQVAWTVVSDARDKTNFASVPHGLNFVEQLNPIAYQFKTSRQDDTPTGIVRYGFKAQDILALEGENSVVIDAEDSEKLRINSDSLIPILVNAIKELSARVAALEASNG